MEISISNSNLQCDNLFISKINNILVANYKTMYAFLHSFFRIGQDGNKIIFGNKVLNNKNSVIFNFLDYSSIYSQLTMEKGTLLYEYIMQELTLSLEEESDQINDYLDDLLRDTIKNSHIQYDVTFNVDVSKALISFGKIKIDQDITTYIQIITLLLQKYLNSNSGKTVIILLNNNIFENIFNDMDGVYIFNFYNKKEYNILISTSVVNYDQNMILNYCKMNWPLDIDIEQLEKLLQQFLSIYFINNNTSIDNYEIYVLSYLFSLIVEIPFNVRYSGNYLEMPSEYKKFTEYLKK